MTIRSAEDLAFDINARNGTRVDGMHVLWMDVERMLPRRHVLLINGPRLDGAWSFSVIDKRKGAKQVLSASGGVIGALTTLRENLRAYVAPDDPRYPKTLRARDRVMPPRGKDGRFLPHVLDTREELASRVIDTPVAQPDKAQGFTRNRDIVAYLIGQTGRVTQYELREVYGIKNPAQAVNEFEEQYHVKLLTGSKMENGDIPYTLVSGNLPAIAGMVPMFVEGIEDPDDQLYVQTLALYVCKVCGRSPVFRPTKTPDGRLYGICPRHGPQEFTS